MPRRSSRKRPSSATSEAESRSSRRGRRSNNDNDNNNDNDEVASDNNANDNNNHHPQQQQQQRSVASHVRERQRAVAEREAARLARPEARPKFTLGHADRKKSAVTSTPSGYVPLVKKNIDKNKAEEEQEGWCGPFSVARQMIAEREAEAKRRKEEDEEAAAGQQHPLDEAMKELHEEMRRKQHPSLLWKSHATFGSLEDDDPNDDDDKEEDDSSGGKKKKKQTKRPKKVPSFYATRKRRAALGQLGAASAGPKGGIPSLYDMCIHFMVQHFDMVESVGHVDSTIRKRLAHELVARNTLHDTALQALCVPGMEALELVDASGITSEALHSCLKELVPAGLRYLALDQAGRCFRPSTVQLLVEQAKEQQQQAKTTSSSSSSSTFSSLQALAIGGAYLLKDENASKLVSSFETTLQSIEFKACPLVGEQFCQSLVECKNLVLREVSLEDLTFSDAAWSALLSAAEGSTFWSQQLESLRLKRLEGLDDDKISKLLSKPQALTALDLSLNVHLSDATLGYIRASPSCGTLSELRLSGLKLLTSTGLEALFLSVPNGGPPPCFRLLDVGQCDHQAVTDQVVELVAQASSSAPTKSSNSEANSNSNNSGSTSTIHRAMSRSPLLGIAHLKIQGSSVVTDASMEVLVAMCGTTLTELNVSYCTQLTDQGLGYLVDHCGNQLSNLQVWGLAQLSELFLDGHRRVKDPSLQIVGAWMKKNSILAIR